MIKAFHFAYKGVRRKLRRTAKATVDKDRKDQYTNFGGVVQKDEEDEITKPNDECTKQPLSKVMMSVAIGWAAYYIYSRFVRYVGLSYFSTYRALSGPSQIELDSYIVSMTNAFICVLYSAHKAFFCSFNYSYGGKAMAASMLGYFINDVVLVRSMWRKYLVHFFHHAVGISLNHSVLCYPQLQKFMPFIIGTEISTIPFHIREVLKILGHGQSTLANICAIAFFMLFFLFRTVWLPIFVFTFKYAFPEQWEKDVSIVAKASVFSAVVLQFFWFFKLLVILKKKLY